MVPTAAGMRMEPGVLCGLGYSIPVVGHSRTYPSRLLRILPAVCASFHFALAALLSPQIAEPGGIRDADRTDRSSSVPFGPARFDHALTGGPEGIYTFSGGFMQSETRLCMYLRVWEPKSACFGSGRWIHKVRPLRLPSSWYERRHVQSLASGYTCQ